MKNSNRISNRPRPQDAFWSVFLNGTTLPARVVKCSFLPFSASFCVAAALPADRVTIDFVLDFGSLCLTDLN